MKEVTELDHQHKTKTEREIAEYFLKALVDEYNYSQNQIGIEYAIPTGRRTQYVDAVVFKNTQRKEAFILVEFKKDIKHHLFTEQIKSYLVASEAEYAIITDGIEKYCFQKVNPGLILRVSDIPKKGEKGRIFVKEELITTINLEFLLKNIIDYLWSNEGITQKNAFKELNKILLAKIVDESMPGLEYLFQITPEEALAVEEDTELKIKFVERMQHLFEITRNKYPALFEKEERMRLRPKSLSYIVSLLQPYSLSQTSEDEITKVYQKIISTTFRGAKGEIFTPPQIAEFIIDMLDPKETDKIIDPACGTGTFLIKFLHKIWNKIDKNEFLTPDSKTEMKHSITQNNIYGIDVNENFVNIAKMNMMVHGNGHERIYCADTLLNVKKIHEIEPIGGFDLVVTNPPFGRRIKEPKILKKYVLSEGRKSQDITVLFLERCIQLARSKGKIAIIIPDQILTNVSMNYVRDFLRKNTEIRAIISLPSSAFAPYAGLKTSLFLLEKNSCAGKDFHDYEIFMAIAKNIGYNKTDQLNKNDLYNILEHYKQFQSENINKFNRIKEKPLIFQINTNQLEKRLDPKYYDPDYITLKTILSEHVVKRLGDVAEINRGISIQTSKYGEKGLPYIRISNITKTGLDLSNVVRISKERLKNIERAQLQGEEILYSITGTIGKITIVPEFAKSAIVSSDIAIIKPKVKTISAYYLYKVLSSSLVENQIKRVAMGHVIPRVNLSDLKSIEIPIFSKNKQQEIELEVKSLLEKQAELQREQEKIAKRMRRLI